MRPSRWLAALLLASSAVPTLAVAQTAPERIVVVRARDEAGAAAGARLADALVERLRRAGHEARRPQPPPQPEPVGPTIARAREAYANLHPAEALALTGEALRVVDERGAGATDRADLVGLLVLRAMAALAQGDADLANGALDEALAADPEIELDPARYPPPIRERLDARRQALGDARHALTLEGAPPGADVRIDGQPAGAAPFRWELPPGVHRVSVTAPGRVPFARRVELAQDTTLTVDAPDDPERVLSLDATETAELREAARALHGTLVVVDVRGDRVVVSQPDDGRRVRLRLDGDADALAAQAERTLTSAPAPDGQSPPEEPGPSPVPWLVAGGVAMVVGAAVLAVILMSSGQSPEGGRWTR